MILDVTEEIEKKIEKLASHAGMSVSEYITSVFFDAPDPFTIKRGKSTETWAEIVAPIHEDFKKSGMTVEEVDDLIAEAVKSCRERRG
jgi:hypothetical protein